MKYLHTMVRVTDLEKSLRFYRDALGLTEVARNDYPQGRFTLIYLAAPPEMRGRLYGVLSVCIGSGPIGFLWLGVLADEIGAPAATAVTGALGLISLALTRRWWGRLTAARSFGPT